MRARSFMSAIALAGLILSACGSGGDSNEPDSTATAQPSTASPTRSGEQTPVSQPATTTASPTTASATATAEASPTIAASPTTAAATATNPPAANTPAPTPIPPTPTPPPASGNPLSASVGVSGTVRYFWSPSSVKIAPGGTVTFAWDSNAAHDLSIPALGVSTAAKKSYSQTVSFPNPGTYQVVCVIHSDTMVGSVIVQ